MRNLISFMHISLDGFVAGPNGEMDWIRVDEELFDHVGIRIGKGDTAMYGRVTYQMMESYWPTAGDRPDASKHDREHAKWYKEVRKVVLSKTLNGVTLHNTIVISEHIATEIGEIKQNGEKEILLFGSPAAAHSLMKLNLIDGFWLFVNPVLIGEGIPLFPASHHKLKLNRLSTHNLSSGVTELNYLVER